MKYYMLMLSESFLEVDDDTDTEYVGAYIHETERGLIRKLGGSGNIRDKIFPRLRKLGVLGTKNGSFYLLKYYRKGDDYTQPRVIRKEINKLKEVQGKWQTKQIALEKSQTEMEKTIQDLLGLLSTQREVITSPRTGYRCIMHRLPVHNAPVTGAAVSLYSIDQKDLSLSLLNKLVSVFYTGIGQSRISATERANSIDVYRRLEKDGFTPYEIAIAVDWTITPGNTTAKIRSFGILSSTISQALKAVAEVQDREDEAQEQAEAENTEKQEKQDEQLEREKLVALKNNMSQDERVELREEALSDLRELGVYQENMITDILISIQENEILRKKAN